MRISTTGQLGSPVTSAVRTAAQGSGAKPAQAASVPLRLKVFLTRGRLDRQIADGRSGEATPSLALRIRQLTARRTRQQTARELRGVVEGVETRPSGPVISAVVIEPAAVRAGRLAILGLADRLDGAAPLNPRGLVLARALLTDGGSPFYNPYSERTVTEAVIGVHDALEEPINLRFDASSA